MDENKEKVKNDKRQDDNENTNVVFDTNCDEASEEKLKPWLSIWTKPRKTMRYIIDNQPRKYVLLIAIIYGILTYLDNAVSSNMGDSTPMWGIILRAITIGGLGGIVLLYILAGIIKWTGKLLKGKGTMENIRSALAWGSLPYIVVSVLRIPQFIIFGADLFKSDKPTIDLLSVYGIIFTILYFTTLIWGLVLQCKCLGEVQEFSVWKAILNYILTGIIAVLLLIIVILFIFGLYYGRPCAL